MEDLIKSIIEKLENERRRDRIFRGDSKNREVLFYYDGKDDAYLMAIKILKDAIDMNDKPSLKYYSDTNKNEDDIPAGH